MPKIEFGQAYKDRNDARIGALLDILLDQSTSPDEFAAVGNAVRKLLATEGITITDVLKRHGYE